MQVFDVHPSYIYSQEVRRFRGHMCEFPHGWVTVATGTTLNLCRSLLITLKQIHLMSLPEAHIVHF